MAVIPMLPSLVVTGTLLSLFCVLPGFVNYVYTGKTTRRVGRDLWDIRMDTRDSYMVWRQQNPQLSKFEKP